MPMHPSLLNRQHHRAEDGRMAAMATATRNGIADLVRRTTLSAACVAMAAAYFWLAWQIVFVWRIGPIVGTISESSNRGVHSGDVMALPLVALGVITLLAGVVSATGRIRRPARRMPEYRPEFA